MDYLDVKKQSRHHVMLFIGYVLVAVAIVLAARILVYRAYGFGIGKNGTVIQNGLIFFSSQPNPANIYINGQPQTSTTNVRLLLPEGIYHVKLTRNGYLDWQRTIELDGGSVEHFDYPLLVPRTLTTKKVTGFTTAPGLVTQSPDQRWLLVEAPGSTTDFSLYDLKNIAKPPVTVSLPANLITKAASSETWQLGEWADDNQHVLLEHDFDGKIEYILLDRASPSQSVNLNTVLAANPAKLTLKNKKYDQYYLYDNSNGGTLQTATLKSPVTPVLQHVLAYQSYGAGTLLYVTSEGAKPGTVQVKISAGGQTQTIRSLPAGTNYLVDLTEYSGTMYVAAGATADNKVYIYQDPVGQLAEHPGHAPVPAQVLHIPGPNYVSFSPNAQFIMASGGNYFGVYDIENQNGYNYTTPEPMDPPQTHAIWMDGDRLAYVSGGKLLIFDYDNTNHHLLTADAAQYPPAFAPDYKDVYMLAPGASGQFDLTDTSLLTPADR